MSDSLWPLFAIGTSLFVALQTLLAEYFKVNPLHLLIWMRGFAVLILSPVIFLLPWPVDPMFYFYVGLTTLIATYFDLMYFGAAAKHGAGVVSRIMPITVGISFVLWTALNPDVLTFYLHQPLRSLGIIAALTGVIGFSLSLRACPLSKETLKIMLPALCLGSLVVVFGKLAMDHSPFHSGVFYYGFVQSIAVFVLYALLLRIPFFTEKIPSLGLISVHASTLMDRRVLFAGLFVSLAWVGSMITKYYAFSLVINPAYVALLELLAPFWILLLYRLLKRRDDSRILPGLGIVFCVALLIISTQL